MHIKHLLLAFHIRRGLIAKRFAHKVHESKRTECSDWNCMSRWLIRLQKWISFVLLSWNFRCRTRETTQDANGWRSTSDLLMQPMMWCAKPCLLRTFCSRRFSFNLQNRARKIVRWTIEMALIRAHFTFDDVLRKRNYVDTSILRNEPLQYTGW